MALPVNCSASACTGAISHASIRPPDAILHRSFTRPSTALAVIEGLGTRLGVSVILIDFDVSFLLQLLVILSQEGIGIQLIMTVVIIIIICFKIGL